MIDHGCNHAAEAEIKAHLHGHEHHGEHDTDQGGDELQPVMKKFRAASVKINGMGNLDALPVVPDARYGPADSVRHAYGALTRMRLFVPSKCAPIGIRHTATAVAQLKKTEAPNTIAALVMANSATPSRRYCSQITKT